MESQVDLHSFADRDSLTAQLAETIAALLNDGIKRNSRASIAVSGGSTPVELFENLSNVDLPWQNIDVTLVDERWVAVTNTDSNEHLVKTHLLQNKAVKAAFTGMKNSATTASSGKVECARELKKVHHPFDVLLLGMGGDGHTASLFPGATKLLEATDMNSGEICMGIAPITATHERMTLTLPAIFNSKHIFLHITGQSKKNVLEQALADGPAEEMPIRFILRHHALKQKINFSIYWAQ